MLDRAELARDIARISKKLFPDLRDTADLAYKIWKHICKDESFAGRVAEAESSFLLPSWGDDLGERVAVNKLSNPEYTVLSVDGSQIYPDRHVSGAGCFLVNMGGSILTYGNQARAEFFTEPEVHLPEEFTGKISESFTFTPDIVDLLREEKELIRSLSCAQEVRAKTGADPVVFFDGTIVFWYLEGKQPEVREYYLKKYLEQLDLFYREKIVCAGYISMPKSREIINLIKLGLCRFSVANCIPCHSMYDTFPCKQVDQLVDTMIMKKHLKPYERSTVFYSHSQVAESYPEHLKPCFWYLHTGEEVARIETPAWVAQSDQYRERVSQVAIDQAEKGRGYPVCLAEAHEQAVVKGPDREFFYHMIQKIGIEHKKRFAASQKSIKKRGIGI